MDTTLSPVTGQRLFARQMELIELVEQDFGGLSPKLEQIIRAFEYTQIELAVYRERGYGQARGVGQPEVDRCALACAFVAKAVLGLLTTRALIDRLGADTKLRRLCGFDLRVALPSEATFSRAFGEFARGELMQRVHARMVKDMLGEHVIGHISRDSTAIEARESLAKKNKVKKDKANEVKAKAKVKRKRGRPAKDEVRPPPEPSVLERQQGQNLEQMLAELDKGCATGTKVNAQGYKISWKGYKLHLDTACCGVPVSAVLSGANVHDSRVALPLSRISASNSHWLFMRSGVLRQENRKQGVQGCLAASSDVVQALKEGQVEGKFFLGNPPVWAQPGAQQRPKTLHRVDVNLMKPVTVLIACVFARPVVDAFVCIAPLL